ncbi:MAG: tRNA dihydrouridine synthase DusB [Ruminococcus sp.]|nr:tRNA dihydrouridine synthase DusB [Ruminococcus sp.]
MNELRIGNIAIKRTAALAPMASVADRSYRQICREFGAAYVVSEMISSKGLCYNDKKSAKMCRISDAERPCAIQLFGEDPVFIGKAAYLLNEYNPDIIDINMGCPVPKIVGSGSGSALMKDPTRAEKIVRAAVKNSRVPVTVKMRIGWDEDSINAVDFAKRMEQAGANAITVHGRTRKQMYSGKANWEMIARVKNAVSVPVIGNGDVDSAQSCERMYSETGCDLVMIGRASYGKPWIFEEIEHYFNTGEILPPKTLDERMEIMLKHARMVIADIGERQGMKEMRHNVIWYVKGIKGAASLRRECSELVSYSQLEDMVRRILDKENS